MDFIDGGEGTDYLHYQAGQDFTQTSLVSIEGLSGSGLISLTLEQFEALNDLGAASITLVIDGASSSYQVSKDSSGTVSLLIRDTAREIVLPEQVVAIQFTDKTVGVETSYSGGDEIQVNTQTSDTQYRSNIDSLTDGGYVVVWQSNNQDGSSWGIYGQRFDAEGAAVGSEFLVNTATANQQEWPAVAGLPNGGFVVVWQSYDQDGSQWGVYGQRYDSAGAAVGSEFLVNDSGASTSEERASIVELSDGGFIVVWRSSNDDIYSQRFDADGDKVGSQVRVNTNTNGSDRNPDVAAFDGGGYVVTWMNSSRDGSDWGVFGQRFDADGNAVGSEFQVNTTTSDRQWRPDVATFSDGSFVVVWNSRNQDGSDIGVFGQRFDANGTAVGDEFQVNTQTESNQMRPAVAELADGGFVVTWQSGNQDGSGSGIYAQRYDANGVAVGAEFRIKALTENTPIATIARGVHPGDDIPSTIRGRNIWISV